MNRVLSVLAIVVIFCVLGCRDKTNQIPPRSFRVTVKNLVEGSDFLVKQVIIESHKDSTICIRNKGGDFELTGTVKPVEKAYTDLVVAEITFVAVTVKTAEAGNIIKWMIKVNGERLRANGPSARVPIEAQGLIEIPSMNDVLYMAFDQKYCKRGYDIEIGTLLGQPLVLSVR
jgi:hypothetical protein